MQTINTQPTKPLTKAPASNDVSIIEHMARKMVELEFTGTIVNADSLAASGFTIEEINENWEAARDEATIMQRNADRAA